MMAKKYLYKYQSYVNYNKIKIKKVFKQYIVSLYLLTSVQIAGSY